MSDQPPQRSASYDEDLRNLWLLRDADVGAPYDTSNSVAAPVSYSHAFPQTSSDPYAVDAAYASEMPASSDNPYAIDAAYGYHDGGTHLDQAAYTQGAEAASRVALTPSPLSSSRVSRRHRPISPGSVRKRKDMKEIEYFVNFIQSKWSCCGSCRDAFSSSVPTVKQAGSLKERISKLCKIHTFTENWDSLPYPSNIVYLGDHVDCVGSVAGRADIDSIFYVCGTCTSPCWLSRRHANSQLYQVGGHAQGCQSRRALYITLDVNREADEPDGLVLRLPPGMTTFGPIPTTTSVLSSAPGRAPTYASHSAPTPFQGAGGPTYQHISGGQSRTGNSSIANAAPVAGGPLSKDDQRALSADLRSQISNATQCSYCPTELDQPMQYSNALKLKLWRSIKQVGSRTKLRVLCGSEPCYQSGLGEGPDAILLYNCATCRKTASIGSKAGNDYLNIANHDSTCYPNANPDGGRYWHKRDLPPGMTSLSVR